MQSYRYRSVAASPCNNIKKQLYNPVGVGVRDIYIIHIYIYIHANIYDVQSYITVIVPLDVLHFVYCFRIVSYPQYGFLCVCVCAF